MSLDMQQFDFYTLQYGTHSKSCNLDSSTVTVGHLLHAVPNNRSSGVTWGLSEVRGKVKHAMEDILPLISVLKKCTFKFCRTTYRKCSTAREFIQLHVVFQAQFFIQVTVCRYKDMLQADFQNCPCFGPRRALRPCFSILYLREVEKFQAQHELGTVYI